MRMGAWSMARVLRQRIEYYIYNGLYIYLYLTVVRLLVFLTGCLRTKTSFEDGEVVVVSGMEVGERGAVWREKTMNQL